MSRTLYTQVYEMGTSDILLEGGVAMLSIASRQRNRVKLQPCGSPWLLCDLTLMGLVKGYGWEESYHLPYSPFNSGL